MAEVMVVDTQSERVEDWDLIQKIQMGYSGAFDTLFRKYVGKTYNLAMKFLRNEDDAEELVQEVFLLILEKCKFQTDSNVPKRRAIPCLPV